MSDVQRQERKKRKTAAEREARRQEKQPAGSSAAVSHDWPRPKGVPFALPSAIANKRPIDVSKTKACVTREFTTAWDDYDSFYYNGLLNVNFEPTLMPDIEFLRHVKWLKQLKELSKTLGLGTMPFRIYPLYPDLAHQFIASCRVHYSSEDQPVGNLVFKLDGVCYSLTFREICALYGFAESGDVTFIPDRNAEIQELWREISGIPGYDSAKAKHTDVKHPVLRMFLRMLSNTLLCKMEPGKMRKTELVLLHFAIGHHFDYAEGLDMGHRMDFGGIFAHYLEELKDRGLSGTGRTEKVGSLLTPIFRRVQIDLKNREVVTTRNLINAASLKHGRLLAGDWGKFVYTYRDNAGYLRQISLPSHLCRIDSAEALRFRPLVGDFVRFANRPDMTPLRSAPEVAATSRPSRDTAARAAPMPPFPEPPAGTYEDDPFRSWMVSTWRSLWNHISCARSSDVEPPAATGYRCRRHAHSTLPEEQEEDQDDDQEDYDSDADPDSATTSGSPTF